MRLVIVNSFSGSDVEPTILTTQDVMAVGVKIATTCALVASSGSVVTVTESKNVPAGLRESASIKAGLPVQAGAMAVQATAVGSN